jgi:hypothetical protein
MYQLYAIDILVDLPAAAHTLRPNVYKTALGGELIVVGEVETWRMRAFKRVVDRARALVVGLFVDKSVGGRV